MKSIIEKIAEKTGKTIAQIVAEYPSANRWAYGEKQPKMTVQSLLEIADHFGLQIEFTESSEPRAAKKPKTLTADDLQKLFANSGKTTRQMIRDIDDRFGLQLHEAEISAYKNGARKISNSAQAMFLLYFSEKS